MKYIIGTLLAIGMFFMGIGVGFWADSGQDVVKTNTVYDHSEPAFDPIKTASDACVNRGGVPTFSSWDGGVNGCIMVGQSSRDTNVTPKGDQ